MTRKACCHPITSHIQARGDSADVPHRRRKLGRPLGSTGSFDACSRAPPDGDEPFRVHASEIRAAIGAKRALRIEHHGACRCAVKHDPMPVGSVSSLVPLDCEQCEIRQSLPRHKACFPRCRAEAKPPKQSTDRCGLRPQAFILGENAESICNLLCLPITDTG